VDQHVWKSCAARGNGGRPTASGGADWLGSRRGAAPVHTAIDAAWAAIVASTTGERLIAWAMAARRAASLSTSSDPYPASDRVGGVLATA
jgi:hypothetical protein